MRYLYSCVKFLWFYDHWSAIRNTKWCKSEFESLAYLSTNIRFVPSVTVDEFIATYMGNDSFLCNPKIWTEIEYMLCPKIIECDSFMVQIYLIEMECKVDLLEFISIYQRWATPKCLRITIDDVFQIVAEFGNRLIWFPGDWRSSQFPYRK